VSRQGGWGGVLDGGGCCGREIVFKYLLIIDKFLFLKRFEGEEATGRREGPIIGGRPVCGRWVWVMCGERSGEDAVGTNEGGRLEE
jgi:hypothetical protein